MEKAKIDARIVKTKSALAEAFISLLGERHFEDIAVYELCQKAGIRRATFYKHYQDKYHFLACFVRDLRNQFDSEYSAADADTPYAYSVEYVKRVIAFLEKNEALVKNTLESDIFQTILSIITEQNYKYTSKRLEAVFPDEEAFDCPREIVASMLTGGVATTICMWLRDGKKKSAETLANEIGAFMRQALGG